MEKLEGKRFTKLLVKEYVGLVGGGQKLKYGVHKGYHTWKCVCDCGKEVQVREVKLKAGTTRSCGCLRKYLQPKWTLPKGEAAKNLLFSHYRWSAKARKLEFALTKEYFIATTSMNCYYCGCAPSSSMLLRQKGNSRHRSLNGDYVYNGIDRVDNNIGYVESNCLPCCWTCNDLKKDKDFSFFMNHIKKIAKHHKDDK